MNIEHWQGAQLVLATIFVMMSLINLFGTTLQKSKNGYQKAGWLLAKYSERSGMIAILFWGGFWA